MSGSDGSIASGGVWYTPQESSAPIPDDALERFSKKRVNAQLSRTTIASFVICGFLFNAALFLGVSVATRVFAGAGFTLEVLSYLLFIVFMGVGFGNRGRPFFFGIGMLLCDILSLALSFSILWFFVTGA